MEWEVEFGEEISPQKAAKIRKIKKIQKAKKLKINLVSVVETSPFIVEFSPS